VEFISLQTQNKHYLMYKYHLLLFAILLPLLTKAQAPAAPLPPYKTDPKREFRGVWMATVENLDWPTNPALPAEKQKQQLIKMLDAHEQTHINAIIFQVRPAADAFYAKSREPWSKWLTGKQGQAPNPEYDPLEFALTEAHKRGMELHAWFNPYRATMDNRYSLLSPNHITNTKPEWFMIYGGKKLFNPGLPEVREYIIRVILDVVDNYDIDGVHMDDYFYPYAIAGQRINDDDAYKQYGGDFDNIKDWRRNNVDLLIKQLSDSIHVHKPRMKFGISPFGIWANKAQNAEGSDTRGGDSYYGQFADSRKWIREGWIDYINPQLYWPRGYNLAAFEKLLDWWSNNTYNHHLYVGQAPYRIEEKKVSNFKNPDELPEQIKLLRSNPRTQGSVYFKSTSLLDNLGGFTDSLKNNYYRTPAIPPVMLWLDSVAPNAPRNFSARALNGEVHLNWETPHIARDNEPVYGYVIYRYEGTEKIDPEDAKNVLHIQYNTITNYTDTTAIKGKTYSYLVTALDRLKNESERSPAIAVTAP
jgi:uncharacterized lipoprotein YddW (UPF0748 family)